MIREVRAAAAAKWLGGRVRTEAEVATLVAAVLAKRGLLSLDQLAEQEPDAVIELQEAAETMIRMAPVEEDL